MGLGLSGLFIMFAPLSTSLESIVLGAPVDIEISVDTYMAGEENEQIHRKVNITLLREVSELKMIIKYPNYGVYIDPERYSIINNVSDILNSQGVPFPNGIVHVSITSIYCKEPCVPHSNWNALVMWYDDEDNLLYETYKDKQCIFLRINKDNCYLGNEELEIIPLSIIIKADDYVIEKNFEK